MTKQILVSCAKSGCNQMVIVNMKPIDDIRNELLGAGWSSRIELGIEYDYCPTHKSFLQTAPDDDDIWGEKDTAAYIAALENLVDRAAELLSQQRTPDAGQLRTAWDKDCDEWFKEYEAIKSPSR